MNRKNSKEIFSLLHHGKVLKNKCKHKKLSRLLISSIAQRPLNSSKWVKIHYFTKIFMISEIYKIRTHSYCQFLSSQSPRKMSSESYNSFWSFMSRRINSKYRISLICFVPLFPFLSYPLYSSAQSADNFLCWDIFGTYYYHTFTMIDKIIVFILSIISTVCD